MPKWLPRLPQKLLYFSVCITIIIWTYLLSIHDFRENGSTCITLRQCVSASVRQSVTLLLAR